MISRLVRKKRTLVDRQEREQTPLDPPHFNVERNARAPENKSVRLFRTRETPPLCRQEATLKCGGKGCVT